MPSDSEIWVPLHRGPAVPLHVIRRLLDLEDRGVRLTLRPDGTLHVGPRALVRPDDLAFLRAHRAHVIAAVQYVARDDGTAHLVAADPASAPRRTPDPARGTR